MKTLTIDWNELKSNGNCISIIQYLEQNEDYYKKKYHNQIEKIGFINASKGRNIFQLCQYKNFYNLWQMSSIVEKSFFKTPEIFEHLKLLVLIDLIKKNSPIQVNVKGCGVEIVNFLNSKNLETSFNFQKIILKPNESILEKIKNKNQVLYALFWLVYQYIKKLKAPSIRNYRKFENSIFIMDYFAHLNFIKNKPSFYSSNIWEPLLKKLPKNRSVYFLHQFIPTKKIKSLGKAAKKINNFNFHEYQFHNFLELNLNLNIFLKVLFNFILFQLKTKKVLSSFKKETLDEHNSINFLKDSIKKSLKGKELIQNILYIELFDDFFKKIQPQKIGIYLQENQGWEFAFINAWKKYSHGKLFAYNSASISNWDLRFMYPFQKSKITLIKQKIPDEFLVGSKHYKDIYIKNGYNKNSIKEVEALRYLKLSKKLDNIPKGKILIMGSITNTVNEFMIHSIQPLLTKLTQFKWYFKPHPANSFCVKDKNIQIITKDLSEIAKDLDFVICPSDSSVAIDCYLLGLNFLVLLRKGFPNTSTLKNINGINFAYSTNDIKKFILSKNREIKKDDFFNLDKNLNKWNLILQKN